MTRRGLTLLEVVLATALLALAATGVASGVSSITRPTEQSHVDFSQLAATIDAILRNPALYKFDSTPILANGRDTLQLDGESIQIVLKTRSGRGAWLEFARGDQRIARWVRVPEQRP